MTDVERKINQELKQNQRKGNEIRNESKEYGMIMEWLT